MGEGAKSLILRILRILRKGFGSTNVPRNVLAFSFSRYVLSESKNVTSGTKQDYSDIPPLGYHRPYLTRERVRSRATVQEAQQGGVVL